MRTQASLAASLWRGHLLLFDSPPLPSPTSAQGTALLLIVLLLEGLLRPLLRLLARSLGIAANPWWLLALMCLLTLSAFGLVLAFAKLAPAALGLRPWREWSRTEKLYLLQVVPFATLVFSTVFADGVRAFLAHPGPGRFALLVLLPQLVWGFYQELLYRGMLQTELVRRLGTTAGIVTSSESGCSSASCSNAPGTSGSSAACTASGTCSSTASLSCRAPRERSPASRC